jgi:ABC-2 type transport system permease protein
MWKNIIKFELSYQKARPITYIYFAILFVLAFVFTATPAKESLRMVVQVKENVPLPLFILSNILGLVSIFIVSAVMGVAILRDFDHNMEVFYFTTNIKKFDYLFGRFAGSFLVLCVILLGIPLGLMLGQAMPWQDAGCMGPFRLFNYFNPYFLLLLPNAFILSSVFFTVGALGRKMIYVFLQGLTFFILYQFLNGFLDKVSNKKLGTWLDPLGLQAAGIQSRYWTINEKSFRDISLSGDLLYNRSLWCFLGVLCLISTYHFFSFTFVFNSNNKEKRASIVKNKFDGAPMPFSIKNFEDYLSKIPGLAHIYYFEIVKSLSFIALTVIGVILFFIIAQHKMGHYDSGLMPSTALVLESLTVFTGIFSIILMIIFVGDLVWRERDIKFNLLQDSLPIPSWIFLLAKYIGLALSFAVFMTISIGAGIAFQVVQGFYDFDLGLYFITVFGNDYSDLLIFMLLGFFIHVIVNNKYLGHAIFLFILLSGVFLRKLGIETPLLEFASGSLGQYSEMNGFGHSLPLFLWLKTYWLLGGTILFIVASVGLVRGTEVNLLTRIKSGQVSKYQKGTLIVLLILMIGVGGFVFYNTKILNTYQSEKEQIKERIAYQKALKQYENRIQPKIVDVKLNLELYPSTRDYQARGVYWLKNKNQADISELYIFQKENNQFITNELKLNEKFKLDNQFVKDFGFYIYKLEKPLSSGDSIRLDFDLKFETKGFEKDMGVMEVVANGTFINNDLFPMIGYIPDRELPDQSKKKEHGLLPNERALSRKALNGLPYSRYGNGADLINFEATIGTELDQMAITPGYLQKEWKSNNRRYFSYKMDKPMVNIFSIVSARYSVKKEIYKGVNLEMYYLPIHTSNIDRKRMAMKRSLDYYQTEFGLFQYQQIRIMEFPLYRSFTPSFPNIFPFCEILGFNAKLDDIKNQDLVTFITAH